MNRRSLLLGLGAALAAPAIVKAENLMKIAALREDIVDMPGGIYEVWAGSVPSQILQLQLTATKISRGYLWEWVENPLPGHLST